MSDPNLAAEEAAVVGARVDALLVGRQANGQNLPPRPAAPANRRVPDEPVEPATVEAKVQRLRSEFEDALAEIGSRIRNVGARADAAVARADAAFARADEALAAGEALADELRRLSAVLPPDVAAEVDGAVQRFVDRLQTA